MNMKNQNNKLQKYQKWDVVNANIDGKIIENAVVIWFDSKKGTYTLGVKNYPLIISGISQSQLFKEVEKTPKNNEFKDSLNGMSYEN